MIDALNIESYCLLVQLLIAFVLGWIVYSYCPKWSIIITIGLVAIFCLREIYICVSQLSGYMSTNQSLFDVTGSFENPGPCGGFLAVCISLLAAYGIKNKNNLKQNIVSRLSYQVVLLIAVAALIVLPCTQSRSAMLALVFSMAMLAFGTDSIRERIMPILKKYGVWILLGVVLLGTGAYLVKKSSADGRVFMDKICIKAMYANGLKGAGSEHFGGAYGQTQARYFKSQIDKNGKDDLDWTAINEHDRMTADCPDNAFNEYLFVGVEYGLIAMLLLIALFIVAIVVSYRRDTIWCFGLITIGAFALFSFPLHLIQFRIMFILLMAACLSGKKKLPALISMTSVLLVLFFITVKKLPEIKEYKKAKVTWLRAERWYHMNFYEYLVEDCESLVPYMRHDYKFLFKYGHSLNKTGNFEMSDSILKIGTEYSSDPMFWNVMGNNSLAKGDYREAERCYKYSFYMVPNRLYPLYLLAKLYYSEGDRERFLDMAERVESFVPKVESGTTESLRLEIRELKSDVLQ